MMDSVEVGDLFINIPQHQAYFGIFPNEKHVVPIVQNK